MIDHNVQLVEGVSMAMYMSRFSYTPETWAGLIKSPENREEAVGAMLERSGCKLHHLWYAFGEEDGFALIEAPDNTTVASVVLAISSSGAFSMFKTSVLMTQDETMEALSKAREVAYTAPGQAVHA
jgi:uncharacterized protein with GYD domain